MGSVFLFEMTRKEFRELLDSGRLKAVVVPTGSSEQHNEHLAMITDTACATVIAERAAKRLSPAVVVTTPVPIGYSEYWITQENRAGTLTTRPEILQEIVFDVLRSLQRQAVKNILILNGHGGNAKPISSRLEEFIEKLGINVAFHSYWDLIPQDVLKAVIKVGTMPGHAGEFETAIMLYLFPDRVRRSEIVYDEAKAATPEQGEKLVNAAVDGVVAVLEKMIAGPE